MEFGKVSIVDDVHWKTPQESTLSTEFLRNLGGDGAAQFFIGAPAWGHKEWIGKIYPQGTPAKNFLHHYSRVFNTIELNTTHYRIPTADQITAWTSQVADGFLFCPKAPQSISHSLDGMRDLRLLNEWWQALRGFGRFLGPSFIQFSPHFNYHDKADLFNFLNRWPDDLELCLEFRHPSWFTEDGQILPALVKFLQGRRIGLVITDVAGRQDVFHTSISADFTMIRFIGNALHASDFERADQWASRLDHWQKLGLRRVFFMLHQPDDHLTPEMTEYVIEKFNSVCDAGLAPIQKLTLF